MVEPGYRIAGRYELIECLGEGRIGRVFRALDHGPASATGRGVSSNRSGLIGLAAAKPFHPAAPQGNSDDATWVTVKLPHQQHSRQPEFMARFRREFVAGQRLIHPALVRCLDMGEFSGLPFLVSEFVAGKPIDQWFREADRDFERLAEVLIKLLDGLAAAHQNRLVHRELKPNNIIIGSAESQGDQPRLLDFGLAGRLEDQLRGSHESASSLAFLSPEQALGERGDERSDLYSLGAILYTLVAGRAMFTMESAPALLLCHINNEPTPLSRLRADVPLWLERLVTRLVQKNPDRRPASAQEVMALVRRRRHAVPVQAVREELWWARDEERALLAQHLQALKSEGKGSSLWISGPLGCGLSSLLGKARDLSRELGCNCFELGGSEPQMTLLQFLRHPDLVFATAGQDNPVERVIAAVMALRKPLVILVDNGERADEEVGQILTELARLAGQHPLVVIVACQDSAAPQVRAHFAREMVLKGWSREVCAAYIEDRLWATPPGEMVQWTWKVSQGNPTFLRLLLEKLEGRHFRVETGEISWNAPPAQDAPESLNSLLQVMLAQQGPEVSERLGVAACLGESFELNLLRAVSLKDDAQLEQMLEGATRSGWLEELWEGGVPGYRFCHPCRYRAALDKVPARRQRRYHLLVGAFWERAHRQVSDWEKACYHYELAQEWELALRSLLKVLQSCADLENWAEARYWMRRCRAWAQELPATLRADQIFPTPWGNFGWSGRLESTGSLHFLAAQLRQIGALEEARWYLQAAFEEGLDQDLHRLIENRLLMAVSLEPAASEYQALIDEALALAVGPGLEHYSALASALRLREPRLQPAAQGESKREISADFEGFRA